MHTLSFRIDEDYMPVIERTVAVFRRGGTVIFPTDTLYGLGCNALDAAAVAKVFDIKHRSYVKALPMLVRDISWARELAYITPQQEKVITQLWPGRVTFILPRRPIVPAIMCGGGQTVGIRAPDYSFIQTTLRHLGYPIAATSAPQQMIAPQPDLFLDCGVLPDSPPSTVVDFSSRVPRILRQGAVRADKILALL